MQSSTGPLLLTHHEDHKTIRQYGGPGSRVVCSWRRRRAEFRRHQINLVRFGVERHGSRAALRCNTLYNGELVWRILVYDGQGALTTGGKRELCAGIEAVR